MASSRRYILTLSCPDRVGIVAAVSSLIAANNGWISEAQHHSEQSGQRFFMRQEILADSLPFDLIELRRRFLPVAEQFAMTWQIRETSQKNEWLFCCLKAGTVCMICCLGGGAAS